MNVCKVCGERVLPQDQVCSWLGLFHQVCFQEAMRCARFPKLVRMAMVWHLSGGIARAKRLIEEM
jgi:hypothetical protein